MAKMDIQKELSAACVQRDNYAKLFKDEWPSSPEFVKENLKYQIDFALELYALDYHVKELAEMVLRDENCFLEDSQREEIGGLIKKISQEIEFFRNGISGMILK